MGRASFQLIRFEVIGKLDSEKPNRATHVKVDDSFQLIRFEVIGKLMLT